MSPAANPANPAPSLEQVVEMVRRDELGARLAVHVDELGEDELDAVVCDVATDVVRSEGLRFRGGWHVAHKLLLLLARMNSAIKAGVEIPDNVGSIQFPAAIRWSNLTYRTGGCGQIWSYSPLWRQKLCACALWNRLTSGRTVAVLMCGIVGIFCKSPALEERLGELVSGMLIQMGDRGPDSAGVAIYRDPVAAGREQAVALFGAARAGDWTAVTDSRGEPRSA